MRRITKLMTGLALAAGVFGGSAAMAMDDGYSYRSSTTYYYSSPNTTYYHTPGTTDSYYGTYNYNYAPSYGYYDNPYRPYWGYQGPMGQGSGHDMRFGR